MLRSAAGSRPLLQAELRNLSTTALNSVIPGLLVPFETTLFLPATSRCGLRSRLRGYRFGPCLKASGIGVSHTIVLAGQARNNRLSLGSLGCRGQMVSFGRGIFRVFDFTIRFVRVRIGYHNNLAKNLVELVLAVLIISSPLDEDI